MRNIQSPPPLVEAPPASEAPAAVAATAPVHRIGEQRGLRTITRPQPRQTPVEHVERRRASNGPLETERRVLTRRIRNTPVLTELRSGRERRRRNQRKSDLTTAIDEKI